MNSNNALIPLTEGKIQGHGQPLCDARDLHAFLGVKWEFAKWISQRIAKYGFVEGVDFIIVDSGRLDSRSNANQVGHGGDRRSIEYHITIDMAKQLAMVQDNERGRQARLYFIECERIAFDQRERKAELQAPFAEDMPAIDQGLVYSQPLCLLIQPQADVICVMPDNRMRSFGWRDRNTHHHLVIGAPWALTHILEGHAPIPHYTLFGAPLWFDLLGRRVLMAVGDAHTPTREDLQPLPAARSLIIGREFEIHNLYEHMGYSVARYLVPREPGSGTCTLV